MDGGPWFFEYSPTTATGTIRPMVALNKYVTSEKYGSHPRPGTRRRRVSRPRVLHERAEVSPPHASGVTRAGFPHKSVVGNPPK